ncbi:MAG: hypothetical protein ACKKL4_01420 [Patescibacteria group bacterium]
MFSKKISEKDCTNQIAQAIVDIVDESVEDESHPLYEVVDRKGQLLLLLHMHYMALRATQQEYLISGLFSHVVNIEYQPDNKENAIELVEKVNEQIEELYENSFDDDDRLDLVLLSTKFALVHVDDDIVSQMIVLNYINGVCPEIFESMGEIKANVEIV